jgi:fatty acid desaturase
VKNLVKKTTLNQLLFFIVSIVFFLNWYFVFKFEYPFEISFLVSIVCLHYLFTTVHQSSHFLLSKNSKINYSFGFLASLFAGITFADFLFTHTIHHKMIGDPKNDPDHLISGSGPVISIPFKIWLHDYYFFKNNKVKHQFVSYFLTRITQVCIVIFVFLLTGQINLFLYFWLLPMLVVGLFNSYFLFYIPHYEIKGWCWKTNLGKHLIKTSRISHHNHHDNPSKNKDYFPLEEQILYFLQNKKNNNFCSTQQEKAYIYIS